MHILHILDHSIPLQSGYSFRTRAILEHQRLRGWQTSHITSAKHDADVSTEEEVDGYRFYRSPRLTGLRAELPILSQLAVIDSLEARIEEVLPDIAPDVLHAHSPALNGAAALRVSKRHGLPLVYEVRAFWEDAAVDHGTSHPSGMRYRLSRFLETYVMKKADAVTTICRGLREEIAARGIAEEKLTVIPNAVNPALFNTNRAKDQALAKKLGLGEKCVLGFIGSFYAYEGLTLLLDALPGLLSKHPDVKLLLVGGGPQEGLLRRMADERGLADRVVFTGRVPHEEVQLYYDLVDIFVYPRFSMRLTELVTPLKPLEAMAQGKLVVASDVGGHRELIRPGETGELFKAGDANQLISTVHHLLSNPATWEQRRQAGRRFVEDERSWTASVACYAQVYDTAMNS